jgi:hypothetical protein
MLTLLFIGIVSESTQIDSTFSYHVISDSVLVHDFHFEDVVRGTKSKSFVPDGTFTCFIFCSSATFLLA